MPTLIGKPEKQKRHKYLYFEFYEEGGKQAVVADNWKYIKLNVRRSAHAKQEQNLLYRLNDDESELTDLSSRYPNVVKKMEKYMQKAHKPFSVVSLFNDDGKNTDMSHD